MANKLITNLHLLNSTKCIRRVWKQWMRGALCVICLVTPPLGPFRRCAWPFCLTPPEVRLPTLHVYCVKLFDILHIIYKQNIRNALTISCMEIDLAKAISFCLPFFMVASMVWKIHAISHDRDFKWNWDGCIGWWRGMHKQRMHIICPRIKIFRFCPVVYNMDNWKTCTKCLYTIYIVQYLLLHTYHNY